MGAIRAGDIRQFIIDGREFDPAPESDWNDMLGGFSNEYGLTGNGQSHITQSREPAGVDAIVSVDVERGDKEFIKELRDNGTEFPYTLTYANGETYSGVGVITEEVQYSARDGQMTLNIRGPRLERI